MGRNSAYAFAKSIQETGHFALTANNVAEVEELAAEFIRAVDRLEKVEGDRNHLSVKLQSIRAFAQAAIDRSEKVG